MARFFSRYERGLLNSWEFERDVEKFISVRWIFGVRNHKWLRVCGY